MAKNMAKVITLKPNANVHAVVKTCLIAIALIAIHVVPTKVNQIAIAIK